MTSFDDLVQHGRPDGRPIRVATPEPAPAEHAPGTCRRCGACCAEIGTPPYMADELGGLPDTLIDTLEAFFVAESFRSESGKPCFFFDQLRCTCLVYPYRPRICREFEPDGDGCRAWREGKDE